MSNLSRKEQIAALIDAEVVRGMAPYRALGLPADVLDEMEATLRFGLATHPHAQHLLYRLTDDPVLIRSEEINTSGVEAGAAKALKKDEGV